MGFALACVLCVATAARRTKDSKNCAKWLKPDTDCEIAVAGMGSSGFVQQYIARLCPESCPTAKLIVTKNKNKKNNKKKDNKKKDKKKKDNKKKDNKKKDNKKKDNKKKRQQ